MIILKRFIDDLFLLFRGTKQEFDEFLRRINNIHSTIKFTSSYNLKERSTTFLDVELQIKNGVISTDLFRKPTD